MYTIYNALNGGRVRGKLFKLSLILKPAKRSLQILLDILKVSYLTDCKSSFKSHKQFKTNFRHFINI